LIFTVRTFQALLSVPASGKPYFVSNAQPATHDPPSQVDAQDKGPYLALAVICERALIEKDDVMSLVRIFDQWNVKGPFQKMPVTFVSPWVVVSFRAGSFRGKADISISPKTPAGNDLPRFQAVIHFGDKGDQQTANVIAQMGFAAEEEGTYWFDVLLDRKMLTRIPLKLVYERLEGVPKS
jgi:hypothetical protein